MSSVTLDQLECHSCEYVTQHVDLPNKPVGRCNSPESMITLNPVLHSRRRIIRRHRSSSFDKRWIALEKSTMKRSDLNKQKVAIEKQWSAFESYSFSRQIADSENLFNWVKEGDFQRIRQPMYKSANDLQAEITSKDSVAINEAPVENLLGGLKIA